MNTHRPTRTLTLAAIAIGIVSLIFFDVIFFNTSLQPSNIDPQIYRPADWKVQTNFPQVNPNTRPAYGFVDLGASAWQSEPAHYLMARNFREHESPYWNPYSSGGTIGPETLVDIKFSPFTFISAYFFNASSASFDYGLIVIYIIGSFTLLLILNQYLELSLLASITGIIIYLLSGFSVPNLNSHMGQPYFLFPVLLYSLMVFTHKQSLLRWIFIALMHALMLTITFLPTLVLILLITHILNFSYYLQKKNYFKSTALYISMLSLASITGFLLVSFLWFPIIDSFFVTDIVSKFQDRLTQPTHHFENLLSVFTPKHFWETTAPIVHSTLYPNVKLENNGEWLIAYTGVFPAIIASYAISKKLKQSNYFTGAAILILLFSYARIFGLAGFINHIPLAAGIGIQYYGCLSSVALIFLVAQGIENIKSNNFIHIPAIIVLSIMIIGFLILYFKLGFVSLMPYKKYLSIFIYQFFISALIIYLIYKSTIPKNEIVIALIIMVVFELMFYMNTVRPQRYNPVEKQPAFISFLKNHIDDSRVLNIGLYRTLYPEYGAMYGIKQMDTQNPALLPWYRDFYTRHFGSDTWSFLTLGASAELGGVALPDKIISEAALNIANVKYLLVLDEAKPYQHFFHQRNYPIAFQKDGLTIFENVNHLPDAVLLPSLIQSDQIPETSNFNPRLSAITDDIKLIAQAKQLGIPVSVSIDSSIKPLNSSTVTITSFHNTEITLETKSDQVTILALSEVWHPNWKATLDGQAVYIGRINEAFRGIALPAGQHKIQMVYDSAALRYGIRTSIIVSFAILLLLIYVYLPRLLLPIQRKIS